MKKVSVIIPVYKVEKYLNKCIESVVNQTYQNLEIILVDDGSPDSCPKICDEWAEKDGRIKVIHKLNEGQSVARNAGLKIFTGDYLTFVDSDDYISLNLIEECMNEIKDNDFLVFGYNFVDSSERIFKGLIPQDQIIWFKDHMTLFICIMWQIKIFDKNYGVCPTGVWTRLYNSRIIKEKNLYFQDTREIFAEDLYFNLNCFLLSEKAKFLNDPYYNYYSTRPGNSCEGLLKRLDYKLNEINKLSKYFENDLYKSGRFDKEFLDKNYPYLYFLLMRFYIEHMTKKDLYKLKQYIDKIEDKERFYNLIKKAKENKSEYKKWSTKGGMIRFNQIATYYLHCGNIFYKLKFKLENALYNLMHKVQKLLRRK